MVKTGRFFIQVDVNWYDEWGHTVSVNAALLWVLALGQAKRMHSDTLLISQLRRVVPDTWTTEDYIGAIGELIGGDIAPISGDDRAIVLHGFESWNDMKDSSNAGEYGNHIRWHVNADNPSVDCIYCNSSPRLAPIIAPDRYREEKRIEDNNIGTRPKKSPKTTVPETFDITPHLREWAATNDLTSLNLEESTQEFLDYHASKGSEMVDWNRAWQTWIRRGNGWAKNRNQNGKTPNGQSLGQVTRSKRDIALGDVNSYRDTGQDDLADSLQAEIDAGVFD